MQITTSIPPSVEIAFFTKKGIDFDTFFNFKATELVRFKNYLIKMDC
jgi:hypothetical protein